MIEIIISVIIQIATIINGGDADKKPIEQDKDKKAKTEQNSDTTPADGGQSGWEG